MYNWQIEVYDWQIDVYNRQFEVYNRQIEVSKWENSKKNYLFGTNTLLLYT